MKSSKPVQIKLFELWAAVSNMNKAIVINVHVYADF